VIPAYSGEVSFRQASDASYGSQSEGSWANANNTSV
jgi:hypothetical protein